MIARGGRARRALLPLVVVVAACDSRADQPYSTTAPPSSTGSNVNSVRVLPRAIALGTGATVDLAAAVIDASGARVSDAALAYTSSNAAVASVSAAGRVTLTGAGTASITVASNSLIATVPVTAAAPVAGSFHIDLRPIGVTDPQLLALLPQAAARWERVITAALTQISVNLPAGACGAGTPAINGTIQNVVIFVQVDSIDGASKVLAQAGSCVVRTAGVAGGLPLVGVLEFDRADLSAMLQRGTALDVATHEIGHVLGIGTRWNVSGAHTWVPLPASDTTYHGPLGMRAAYDLGFTNSANTPVAVENLGGEGTVGGHWRESVFKTELMTGYLSMSAGTNLLSYLTVQSLADLGYAVTPAGAETFTAGSTGILPAAEAGDSAMRRSVIGASEERTLIGERWVQPQFEVGGDGRVRRIDLGMR